MGHSEMLLAVAGLTQKEIQERTKKLAAGDWSVFPPEERLALHFAHRLASKPSGLTSRDLGELIATFGQEPAVDLIWYGSWCNYMTRVADSFQLPLERDNCFAPLKKEKSTQSKGG
jgi:hypothetical protein